MDRASKATPALGAALTAALCFAVAGPAGAQHFPVERDSLANGLRVLLLPDRSVPSICLAVAFHAGSKNEHPGTTGIAHLFEHMMFNGSARYAPEQFDEILEPAWVPSRDVPACFVGYRCKVGTFWDD